MDVNAVDLIKEKNNVVIDTKSMDLADKSEENNLEIAMEIMAAGCRVQGQRRDEMI